MGRTRTRTSLGLHGNNVWAHLLRGPCAEKSSILTVLPNLKIHVLPGCGATQTGPPNPCQRRRRAVKRRGRPTFSTFRTPERDGRGTELRNMH